MNTRAAMIGFALALLPLVAAAETSIDYNSVDISTLSPDQLTFVPEARKAPYLQGVLAGVDLRPKPDLEPKPYCEALLDDVAAMENVEIVEPVVRTNDYFDPALDFLKAPCPDLDLHYFVSDTGRYAIRGYKVFMLDIPPPVGPRIIFESTGLMPDYLINADGTPRRPGLTFDTRAPAQHDAVDLERCTTQTAYANFWTNFDGAFEPGDFWTEAAIVRWRGGHYWVRVARGGLFKSHSATVVDLGEEPLDALEPDCLFIKEREE